MIQVLILTHGGLATELLAAARTIAGDVPGCQAVTLDWHDSYEAARDRVAAFVAGAARADGVLILTDIYGGTPHNVAMGFVEAGRVEVVTGVNLPMVVRLTCGGQESRTALELAAWIQAKGRKSICSSVEGRGEPDVPAPAGEAAARA